MSTFNGRWIPTPFITISMGIGKAAKEQLIFTTLSRLNKKKYVVDVSITQTSHTTVEYTVNLVYYPNTFEKGSYANNLETKLNLAMRDENTRHLYMTFGYESNSPYSGSAESSPVYKGLITNMTSSVQQNFIKYTITGYGVDILQGAFASIDKSIDKLIKPDAMVSTFVRQTILNNGNITIDGVPYKFKIEWSKNISNSLTDTFLNLLIGTNYVTSNNTEASAERNKIYNQLVEYEYNKIVSHAPSWADKTAIRRQAESNAIAQMKNGTADSFTHITDNYDSIVNKFKMKKWNELIKEIDFETLTNTYVDNITATNFGSADKEGTTDKNQFSIYEAIEIVNRVLNQNVNGVLYNIRCIIEPYSNNSIDYDGTIRVFDANSPTSSDTKFYYGIWNPNSKFSNNCTVVSWDCDYNALAKIFSGKSLKGMSGNDINNAYSQLAKNLNTDLELGLDEFGQLTSNLTNSQTKTVGTTDYRTEVTQNTQYAMMLNAIQNILNYPYEASITVLGNPKPFIIGVDTIEVYVLVNGTEHFTSGEYLITGYSHSISSSGQFHTTYKLLKVRSSTVDPDDKKSGFNAMSKMSSALLSGKKVSDATTAYWSNTVDTTTSYSTTKEYNPKVSGIDYATDPRFTR